jgi:phospholipase C
LAVVSTGNAGCVNDRLTRRELVGAGVAAGAFLFSPWKTLERALAMPAACGPLANIEHVVFLINENRSFDSYFGTYKGVRGFADTTNRKAFSQAFPGTAGAPYGGKLLPFHFDTNAQGECVDDIDHSWGVQHHAWNGGTNAAFLSAHLQSNGLRDGPNTMGYYERGDLPFFHALADAFTICDGYHCSVIGPTDPNRLYSMSATIDPSGVSGGPILSTSSTRAERLGKLTWTTMPEQLNTRSVTWKVYGGPDANFGDNVLPYFRNYQLNAGLAANAFTPTFPGTFEADCAAGTLPQVSWILAPLLQSEHPPAPVTYGEVAAAQVLDALVSNPDVWAKTALFITYDENGGFFDHLPPPVAPKGTKGEWLTVDPLPADASGVAGPIGLGFRVPLLVVSPYARGGFVCSSTFDHTSLIRFLETRFGTEVPNLSAWRRSVTGDLTAAFNFVKPDTSVPSLPSPSLADARVLASDCPSNAPDAGDESFPTVVGYPLPAPPQTMPKQESGTPRRPSGLRC